MPARVMMSLVWVLSSTAKNNVQSTKILSFMLRCP